MGNMSHCRFENTYKDLQDCFEQLHENGIEGIERDANVYEKPYVRKLIELCADISEMFLDELLDSEFDDVDSED